MDTMVLAEVIWNRTATSLGFAPQAFLVQFMLEMVDGVDKVVVVRGKYSIKIPNAYQGSRVVELYSTREDESMNVVGCEGWWVMVLNGLCL